VVALKPSPQPKATQPEAKPKQEIELNISRTEIDMYIEPGVTRKQYAITFWSASIPPRTIFIWKDEWSPEKELEEIKKEIEKMKQERAKTVKLSL
jgi:hypothetical protein